MAASAIDLYFLKHFSFLLLEIYAYFSHLVPPSTTLSLWTLRQRIHLIFFPLLLLAINFPHHFSDLLFLVYLRSLIYFNLLCNLSWIHSPPLLALSFFFTLYGFFCGKVEASLTWHFATCLCMPFFSLTDLSATDFLCPQLFPLLCLWYLLPYISNWLAITYLPFPFFSFSSFHPIALFHCHPCHHFLVT